MGGLAGSSGGSIVAIFGIYRNINQNDGVKTSGGPLEAVVDHYPVAAADPATVPLWALFLVAESRSQALCAEGREQLAGAGGSKAQQ